MEKESSSTLLSNTDHFTDVLKMVSQPDCITSDVTLVCEDARTLKAHRIVLSAVSPILKILFQGDATQDSVIFLNGFKYADIEHLLNFIYLGSTQFDVTRLDEFLNLAENLEIKEINKNLGIESTKNDAEPIKLESHGSKSSIEDIDRIASNENTHDFKDTTMVKNDGKVLPNNKIIAEPKTKMKQCPECDEFFPSMLYMVKHYNSVHKAPAKLLCNQCAYQTTTKTSLTNHMQWKHEGVKYNCNQCSKQLSSSWHLKRHVKEVHSKIKESFKYLCNYCDFKASVPSKLRIHTLGKHRRNQDQH